MVIGIIGALSFEAEEMMGNSFLDASAKGKKVLVIVPHEDDEINVAGSLMYSYVQKGAEVYCAFTTNGDYSFWAKTRITEAVRSLNILGVQHAIFLGYGDTNNNYAGGHLFYAETDAVTSPAGHRETYGTDDNKDYAFRKRGKHSPYCRTAFCVDLESLILDVKADVIVCVDCDYHSDHRAASLLFETVMGQILRQPQNTYLPLVFKGFAYCTSFNAPSDFYADNILSVPKPQASEDCLIDKSIYDWNKRVRFPVFPACREKPLRSNVLYQALFQHASQAAGLRADRIANGDAIFWQRRTDNIVYQARITATSGDASKVADFKLLDTDNIDERRLIFSHYLWQPDLADKEKKIVFQWDKPQIISKFALAGNIERSGLIKALKLSFDNGYTCEMGSLLPDGRVLEKKIPRQHNVKKCIVQILSATGKNYGLSEVGFFSTESQSREQPFIKLQVENQFIYDYLMPWQKKKCQLNVYRYHTSSPVVFKILRGEGKIDANGLVTFSANEKRLEIRAELADNNSIYDIITIERVSRSYLFKQRFKQKAEKILLTFYLKKYRKYTHIRHKYLKKL